jgi:hypothetical protein
MRKNFVRKKEDFSCGNCGLKVKGSGYTNHCPNCLYSKHVDLNIPGDRKNSCGGLMKPIGVEKKGENYIILHQCLKCKEVKKNKAGKNDNFNSIIKISNEQ